MSQLTRTKLSGMNRKNTKCTHPRAIEIGTAEYNSIMKSAAIFMISYFGMTTRKNEESAPMYHVCRHIGENKHHTVSITIQTTNHCDLK